MRIEHTLAGGATIRRPISGRYLLVKAAAAEIIVSGLSIGEVYLGAGESYDLESVIHKDITITNASASNNAFILEVTEQSLRKSNQNALTVNTTATVENGDDNPHLPKVTLAAGASAAIAPANGSRKFLRISLLSSAAGHVTLGKSGVNAASGGPIEPGMVDYMETRGVLWAFNPQAVPVDIYVMEVNKL